MSRWGEIERALETRRSWLVTGAAGFIGSHLVEALLLFGAIRAGLARLGVDCAGIEARFEAVRAGDARASRADLALARAELGYEPVLAFDEGLAQTLRAFAK